MLETATRATAHKRTVAFDPTELTAMVRGIASRRPMVGLAVGVVRDGRLEFFHGHGLADAEARTPVTEDTIFRMASITKTMTAIAVMQLWEQGLVDLDAPANRYLRTIRLVAARPGGPEATVRHLLTHTAGIREALHFSDAFRWRDMGETVPVGRHVPALRDYYHGGLRCSAEPGTRSMYTDHGFAALGQLVEDVSGMPLDTYFRERIFQPLGMVDSGLGRPRPDPARVARPYEIRRHGVEPVPDYELITVGGGAVHSTTRDMARYLAALAGGGANDHGSILKPATLALMFEPHHRPDPRLPGHGLAFFRTVVGGHLGLEHGGTLPGFDTAMCVFPDSGLGVMAFANGAVRGMHWLEAEVGTVSRRLLRVAPDAIPTDIPHHPETWSEICGWYSFEAHVTDPGRLFFGAGAEVFVRGGRPWLRFLAPMPSMYRGLALQPADPDDPYVFRIDLSGIDFGMPRAIFATGDGGRVSALHLDLGSVTLPRRPDRTNPRVWARRAAAALALTGAAVVAARRAGRARRA